MVEFFYWLKNEVGGDFYFIFILIFLRLSLACLTDFWKIFSPAQWGPKMPYPLELTPQVEQVTSCHTGWRGAVTAVETRLR